MSLTAAEVTLLRQISRKLLGLQLQEKLLRCQVALKASFNPDQPRVPAGNPDGGRWTGDGSPSTIAEPHGQMAARRISPTTEAKCELQYQRDIFQCRMVGLPSCYAQAAERYAACLAGRPIPPLNY